MSFYTVSSKRRASGNSNNFLVTLPLAVREAKSVTLKELTLNKSVYNVTSSNNIFPIQNTSGFPATQYLVSIPVGAYNVTQLISQINTSVISSIGAGSGFSIVYNTIQMTVSVSWSTPAFWVLNWASCGVSNLINNLLGYSRVDVAGNSTSDKVIGLNDPLVAYIQVDELGTRNYNSFGLQYTFRCPLNVNSGQGVSLTTDSFYEQKITFPKESSLHQFKIRLVNDDGSDLSLNGSEWEMVLYFE
jgi:hypothetical protein